MSITTRPTPTTTVPALVSAGLTCETRNGEVVEYVNLDHGASTSAFVEVKAAVDEATLTYSSVHRGNGYLSRLTSARYEAARDIVARFVGARSDDHVVFTRNTTDSFNLLAGAVPTDASVFVFDSDHHATFLPWREEQVRRLGVPTSPEDAVARLHTALLADSATERLLESYFPEKIRETYGEAVLGHPLRREIVTTVLANDVVNRGGITFVHRAVDETGATAEQVARAYLVAREIFRLRDFVAEVEALAADAMRNVIQAERENAHVHA